MLLPMDICADVAEGGHKATGRGFPCPRDCGAVLSRNKNVKRHLKNVHNEV